MPVLQQVCLTQHEWLQVEGLQQQVQKLGRQVDQQQLDLMRAEQTIMSLSSGKVPVCP